MRDRGLGRFLDYVRRQAEPETVSDGELLRRYARSNDQAAFELLVRRHGSMVFGVARRMLRDEHAAEDAFQAAFLALARRAKALEGYETVAGWLYRVTQRIAFRAQPKKQVVRLPHATAPEPGASAEWSELRSVLDEEVDRLPDHYRLPVVLCYLSGRTTDEAAQQLGCPRGTVLSRLAAAREKLRGRLTRRGFAVPAAGLTAGLASEAASAGVSASLVLLALKSTGPVATLAPGVVVLAEGVLRAMLLTKVKVGLGAVVAACALGVGVVAGPGPTATQDPQPAGTEAAATRPAQPEPDPEHEYHKLFAAFGATKLLASDSTETRLLKERFLCAKREVELRFTEYSQGKGALDLCLNAGRRLRDSGVELSADSAERINALKAYFDLVAEVEKLNQARFNVGAMKQQDLEMTRCERLEAELSLLRAQRRVPAKGVAK